MTSKEGKSSDEGLKRLFPQLDDNTIRGLIGLKKYGYGPSKTKYWYVPVVFQVLSVGVQLTNTFSRPEAINSNSKSLPFVVAKSHLLFNPRQCKNNGSSSSLGGNSWFFPRTANPCYLSL